ncbi:MAG: undecaprenyl-diphosphate phosphatase [Candidatus Omnitrophica bacterium]|nr:undecaprenyl-diphosphate phosphatase [Candidatus Omnitrophota bacterium]
MTMFSILILSAIQGVTELLPVSSSAHVIVAARLMGFDPASPSMTFFLVMLHTGTMFAVIVFFWKAWKDTLFFSRTSLRESLKLIFAATFFTSLVAVVLKYLVEKFFFKNVLHAEVENLFGNLGLISVALAAVGFLILAAGWIRLRTPQEKASLGAISACVIGAVQGICLPFRGFSRSGATISTGLLLGISQKKAEEFSFALAVILTPPIIIREVWRLLKAEQSAMFSRTDMFHLFFPGLLGMAMSFVFGLLALQWLSNWLERGRWSWFGIYCLCAAAGVYFLNVYDNKIPLV